MENNNQISNFRKTILQIKDAKRVILEANRFASQIGIQNYISENIPNNLKNNSASIVFSQSKKIWTYHLFEKGNPNFSFTAKESLSLYKDISVRKNKQWQTAGTYDSPVANPITLVLLTEVVVSTFVSAYEEKAAMTLVAHIVGQQLAALWRQSVSEGFGLSQRQVECLTWVSQGKSDWEIGQILGLSPKSINMHIEKAKVRIGVSTRMQAIVFLIKCGLLSS